MVKQIFLWLSVNSDANVCDSRVWV